MAWSQPKENKKTDCTVTHWVLNSHVRSVAGVTIPSFGLAIMLYAQSYNLTCVLVAFLVGSVLVSGGFVMWRRGKCWNGSHATPSSFYAYLRDSDCRLAFVFARPRSLPAPCFWFCDWLLDYDPGYPSLYFCQSDPRYRPTPDYWALFCYCFLYCRISDFWLYTLERIKA